MNETRVEVKGSAYAELELKGRWALSVLTEGWSDDERQAFLDGDDEAREALKDALIERVRQAPDDIDCWTFDLRVANP